MSKKILIVLTNHDLFLDGKQKTGLWLGELVHIYDLLKKSGYEIDLMSPIGGPVPLDPSSLKWPLLDNLTKSYYLNEDFQKLLQNTLNPAQINPENYLAICYAGGHGAMWDFPNNEQIAKIAEKIYQNGGIISAVCHGSAGLLNIKIDNQPLVANKKVTGYSWPEEILAGKNKLAPFKLEKELTDRGAIYSKGFIPFSSYTVSDNRLITGQNPLSAKKLAEKILKALSKIG
ncbi:MAG TPA: type 1 glutamine amidotransferase domain-containing protein [Candidatus Udaeobacter sp.]|nr:type 1 glutamine amidotransferase domain-containing protein [Candidatus Udaeobacter sp.]